MRKLYDHLSPAKYTCFDPEDPQAHSHYGLNFPLYTHFTSPIRRYADLLVHRLITICLENKEDTAQKLQEQDTDYDYLAQMCSEKSLAARRASRQC